MMLLTMGIPISMTKENSCDILNAALLELHFDGFVFCSLIKTLYLLSSHLPLINQSFVMDIGISSVSNIIMNIYMLCTYMHIIIVYHSFTCITKRFASFIVHYI